MENFYIKPGNQERGWNDPPQFSYGMQTSSGGAKRNLLNKRVPPPQLTGQSPGPGLPPSPAVSSGSSCSPGPPPVGGLTPPPPKSRTGSLSGSSKTTESNSSGSAENEPNLSDVQASLLWALTACKHTVKKQVCDDVERRLKLFEEMWKNGKLSLAVKCRMNKLSQELKNERWDAADEIHRSLMVDYVNEVSQWMVGVKRLIAETRNLNPELLHTEEAPSQAEEAPSRAEETPSHTEDAPSQAEEPSQTNDEPPQAEAKPTQTEESTQSNI